MSKLKEFYKWFKNGSYPNYHEIEQKIKELLKEEESILPQDKNGWTPTANEMIEVSDDGVKWEERKYCCPHNTKTFTGYCTYGIGEEPEYWRFIRPLQEEKIEEFNWLKICRKSEESGGEGLLWSAVGHQVESITNYLRNLK